MHVTQQTGNHYRTACLRQADKLSTYSIATRQPESSLAALKDVATLLRVELNKDAISGRLNAFENICHVLSHMPIDCLRPSERTSLADYVHIAVQLDKLMLTFAQTLAYEEERQNSRNWIEEHQYRADYSADLAQIVAQMEREAVQEGAA